MKDQILSMLSSAEDFLSGQAISRELGISRAAVWKAIQKFRQEGYVIESGTNRGYRLQRASMPLTAERITALLPRQHPWREQIVCFDSVGSTNTLAKSMASSGAPHGTVLIADHQTDGRGRLGRSFLSPAGTGVYLSVILRPQCVPGALMHLTCAAAAAMCSAVQRVTGIRPGIKWTNDLVCQGRKLAGILTELSIEAESGMVQYAVVGIGINCRQKLSDFPPEIRDLAGSLSMISGKETDRSRIAAAMITALEEMDRLLMTQKAEIMDVYRKDCITVGKEVTLHRGAEVRSGKALDVDENGALIVQLADGQTEAVNSGEVSVRGLYGYV